MEKQKLTICFIGTAESIHMLKWAQYFADKSHKTHLISYEPLLKDYKLGNIKLHLLQKKIPTEIWPFNTLFNLPLILSKVKKIIREIKPDIINAHYVVGYGTLSALVGFHPFIVTVWGSDVLIAPQKFLPSKWSVKYALKKANLITCDAEHMKETMIKLGVDPSKIKIINFGVDTKRFAPGTKDEKLKEKLGISGYKIVISLRSLETIYDITTLIKSIPLVLKEVPKTKFIIAGKGSQEDELKKLTKDLGILGNIKFVGQVPNQDLPKYLRTADVYVSTSLSDAGIASSTAEAMSCGLPVVITNTGENEKWVKDNKNGFIIPTKNPKILAEKIIYSLKNESGRKKFGAKARETIEERNDYYKEMAKMEKIYYELMK